MYAYTRTDVLRDPQGTEEAINTKIHLFKDADECAKALMAEHIQYLVENDQVVGKLGEDRIETMCGDQLIVWQLHDLSKTKEAPVTH